MSPSSVTNSCAADHEQHNTDDASQQPTHSTTSTPCQQVIDTVELLEAILEYLPAKDTLLAQSVCVQFRQTVQTSLRLRQKLHLAPRLAPEAPREIWPFELRGEETDFFYGYPDNYMIRVYSMKYLIRVSLQYQATRDAVADASWRSMLVTQPPITKMRLASPWADTVVSNEEGLTLGQLADELLRLRDGYEEVTFYHHDFGED